VRYRSTRDAAAAAGFADVLVGGLAPGGGLWMPDRYPALDPHPSTSAYEDLAVEVILPYVRPAFDRAMLTPLVRDAYSTFDDTDVCPLRDIGDGRWLLELFHGPTLAFKDVALQLVGRLLDHELARRGTRATILVATSGDTGSAAIAACLGRDALDIVVLHPAGRVSDVQRRQMTTVDAANVHNVAIEGTFDDCQSLVKAMLGDGALAAELGLAAMNSINWARIVSQIVYYAWAAHLLGDGPVAFSVPSGNFGNVLAGWVAAEMGVPVDRLIVGTGRNDLLARWLVTGRIEPREFVATIAPAMDVQIPSNLERLLFELVGRDPGALTRLVAGYHESGGIDAPRDDRFAGARFDDAEIRDVMRTVHETTGVLVDPHTAVGFGAAETARRRGEVGDVPVVIAATAHPAKFPDVVEAATGVRPETPERLRAVLDVTEHYTTLPNDLETVRAHVRDSARAGSRAR
jgi:threonine synthase